MARNSYREQPTRKDRLKGWAMVALVYLAGAAAWWLVPHQTAERRKADPPTVLVDIASPPPPPVVEPPKPKVAPDSEAGAAGKKANPSPIVAPEPKIPAPSPVPAAPVPGTGNATTAGAADLGNGPGAGGSGSGRGGGGIYAPQWLSGGLKDSDYPRALVNSGISGKVSIRFTVMTSGRISNCRIARSSGSGELDALTCRLLTQRLRFVPAKDGNGNAIPYDLGNDYGWGIRRR